MSYMRVYYYENELEDEFSSASIKAKKIDARVEKQVQFEYNNERSKIVKQRGVYA